MSFKENWLKEDERCPTCNQVTRRVRGITKQNLKRLIKPKWDINELTITFLLLFFIIIALLYKVETQAARDWIKNMTASTNEEECKMNCIMQCSEKCSRMYALNKSNYDLDKLNLTNISLGLE